MPNPVAASSSSYESVNNFQLFTSGGQRRDQTAERQTLGLPKNICRTWTYPKRLPLFRKSRSKPNLESTSKYGFSPDLGGKNGGVLSMRMQVILDSPFARPGSAPMWGAGRKESSGTGLQILQLLQILRLLQILCTATTNTTATTDTREF